MQRDAYQAVWTDRRFRGLTAKAKLAFMMIITGPHVDPSLTGLYWWDHTVLSKSLGYTKGDADLAARELVGAGLIHYDPVYRCLYVPMMLDIDRPRSPKNVSGWARSLRMMPESLLRNLWIEQLKEHCKSRGGNFWTWFQELDFEGHAVPEDVELEPVAPAPGLPDLKPATKEDEEKEAALFEVEPTAREDRGRYPEATYLVENVVVPHVEGLIQKKIDEKRRKSWALEIHKIREIDGRPWDLIEEIARWAVEDSFWRQQIQSGGAIRRHFDKILAKKRSREGIVASEAVEEFIKGGGDG
jgi:hypothetical protein